MTEISSSTELVFNPKWEDDPHLVHATTTRHLFADGMSGEERLALIRERLGMPGAISVVMDQVHRRRIQVVDEALTARSEGQVLVLEDTDGVITSRPNVLLHVSTADCVPILALDPVRRIVGAAHAGWRGTVRKIGAKLMRQMARLGADLDRIEVWFGPSICQRCFEVGEDVLKRFTAVNNWWPAINLERRLVDLELVNRLQIARAGVSPESMAASPLCSRCRIDMLHSHRGEPDNPGRMLTVIGLRNSP